MNWTAHPSLGCFFHIRGLPERGRPFLRARDNGSAAGGRPAAYDGDVRGGVGYRHGGRGGHLYKFKFAGPGTVEQNPKI